MINALIFALAMGCPAHLTPDVAGWMPPPVCHGLGRFNALTQNEVQVERNLFQSGNYASDLLKCRRSYTRAPLAECEADARAQYDTMSAGLSGTPDCLDTDRSGDALKAFLDSTLFPILYANKTNSGAQDTISKALAAFMDCISKMHLEKAIDEQSEAQAMANEDLCEANYQAKVAGTGAWFPTTVSLGVTLRAWMDATSDMAFCASEK
jgi:hypothetical protein